MCHGQEFPGPWGDGLGFACPYYCRHRRTSQASLAAFAAETAKPGKVSHCPTPLYPILHLC